MKLYDSTIGPRFSNPKLTKQFGDDQMPQTADNLAREFDIKREQADKFALRSQQRYADQKPRQQKPHPDQPLRPGNSMCLVPTIRWMPWNSFR